MTYIEQRLENLERIVADLQAQIAELQAAALPEKRVEQAPELISMAEAARLAGLHRNTVYDWVRSGRLQVVERVGRENLVRRDDVLRIMEERK